MEGIIEARRWLNLERVMLGRGVSFRNRKEGKKWWRNGMATGRGALMEIIEIRCVFE